MFFLLFLFGVWQPIWEVSIPKKKEYPSQEEGVSLSGMTCRLDFNSCCVLKFVHVLVLVLVLVPGERTRKMMFFIRNKSFRVLLEPTVFPVGVSVSEFVSSRLFHHCFAFVT